MEIIVNKPEIRRTVLRTDIYKKIRVGVIDDYYNTSLTIKEIMLKYGVSKATCYKYIQKYGKVQED